MEIFPMKILKRAAFLTLACISIAAQLFTETSNNFAIQITDLLDTVNQKDLWAVREWLRTKRVALSNKTGDFSLSGDVKAQWRNVQEHLTPNVPPGAPAVNIVNGVDSPSGWTNNLYNIDFRLYFDYKADKTWASVKLDFDEAAGLFAGQANNLALVRANMGYHLFDDGNARLDVLVGRQRAYELYDSQIQFNSTLDGFTGMFGLGINGLADITVRGGGYVFNAIFNQPVWIVQAGIYDILDTGFYAEYSFVNWAKNLNGIVITNTNMSPTGTYIANSEVWSFRNNQFILGYVFNPEIFGRDVRLFGGILWNALARPDAMDKLSDSIVKSGQGLAGWIALQLGSVQKAGDWAFQAQWQVLQPYSVPDWDVAGMGRGNGSDSALFGFTSFSKATNFPGNGNANYNGWELDLLYSVTNEIVLEALFQRALPINSSIGGKSNYTNVVLAAIYGF